MFAIVPVKYLNIENQEFNQRRAIWWILTKLTSALNFLVLATELKLLIFKISARTFLKNLSFRKELKLFATSYKYMYNNNLRTKRNSEPWFFDSFSSRKKNGKMKILAQFSIFIRIIILNIGVKKENNQFINNKKNQKLLREYNLRTRVFP